MKKKMPIKLAAKANTGIEICEQVYQSDSWQVPRRLVIVRQKIKDRPNAPGKQLHIFS